MNPEQFKKNLKSVPIADGLEAKLEANWQQQLQQAEQKNRPPFGRLFALAASIFLAVVVLVFYQQTPRQIILAYDDIVKDTLMKRPLLAQHQQWFAQHNLSAVPENMPLELVKNCRLGEQQHMHLRVAGEHQGKVNVFIRQLSAGDEAFEDAGELKGFRWQRFNVDNNLQVVVLYDEKMRKQGVNHLLKMVFSNVSNMHV